MDAARFLDEFRPFRRGEIALARRAVDDPLFLAPADLHVLRHALRLAQLSTVGKQADALVDRIGSFRLRLLQLLAPALPTDADRLSAHELHELVGRTVGLVDGARRQIAEAGLAPDDEVDDEISSKRLALVLGGAAGAGYVYLGALQRLHEIGIEPAYLVGCSIGAVLAVLRARARRFDLDELDALVARLRADAVFQPPRPAARFGLPAALRLDLRRALAADFSGSGGELLSLRDLPIPVDTLATGLGPAALVRPREEYARMVDADLRGGGGALAELRGSALGRVVSAFVSLAMSRQVLVPVFFGADAETAELPALDAAGFSAAIPALLHYELPPDDPKAEAILRARFERHGIVALVDGALVSMLPARYAWEAIEAGRIGSRNCAIVALDAMAPQRGANAVLAPVQRVIAATAHRDRPFWDLHVEFRRAPSMLDVFPREATLRRAARAGEEQFEETGRLLRSLLAPLPAWRAVRARVGA